MRISKMPLRLYTRDLPVAKKKLVEISICVRCFLELDFQKLY